MSSASGTTPPPTILCAGIAAHDHVYKLDRFPVPGTKKRAIEFTAVGGGCAANAAVAIVRLGGRALLASPLGGPSGIDSIGDRILADLAQEGVDASLSVRVAGATSPISAITVDTSGERLIVNHRDERLTIVRVADPERLVQGCDALLVDNRFAQFVLPLCRAARARGIPILLDGDRPTTATDEILTVCTHVVFAADGLRATTRCDDLERGLRLIAERSDAFLAVTDGANGVLWLAGATLQHFPAYRVAALDTLGCGDVFHGAFILGLAEGQNELQALEFATAAAGIKCTRFGGIAGAPTRVEVAAWLATKESGCRR